MDTDSSAHPPLSFTPDTPVYDRDGYRLGVVSADGLQERYLMMTERHLPHRDVAIPISAVERIDWVGVYLNRSKQEIHDLTLGGWSSLGDVDLDTGESASGRHDPKV